MTISKEGGDGLSEKYNDKQCEKFDNGPKSLESDYGQSE